MATAPVPQPQQGEGRQAYIERLSGLGFEVSTFENSIPDLGRLSTPPHITISGELRPGFSAPVTQPAPVSGVSVDITKPVTTAAFKGSAAYKALSQSAKGFVDIAYNLIEFGGEAEAKFFANAVTQAQAVAEPYFKAQLALAKAEVLGSIAEKNFDYETRKEVIERTRDEILQDVVRNRDFLTLGQQSEIARTVKKYDEDLLIIADEAAEKGLTFATGARSRALAESRRTEQFSDVIQSSTRRHNFQIKELELKAARGDVSAQRELASLSGQKGFALQSIGRAAEEVLGSSNLPSIESFTPVGGTTGKIEEEKKRAIVADTTGFLTLQRGFL